MPPDSAHLDRMPVESTTAARVQLPSVWPKGSRVCKLPELRIQKVAVGKWTRGKSKRTIDFPSHVTKELRRTVAEEEARGEREESSEEAVERARAAATALHTTPLHGEIDVAQGRAVTT